MSTALSLPRVLRSSRVRDVRAYTRGPEDWRARVLPPFQPLLGAYRYKGAHGGRGGAKSHFFAEYLIQRAMQRETRAVCVREVQKSLDQSVKRLLEDKIKAMGLQGKGFRILQNYIELPHGGLVIFQGMQDHTAESIKSLEGYDIAWVEEAQMLSERSLQLLRPTIRKEGSEIWFSWNPMNATDPVDAFLRGESQPPSTMVVETSYEDNPHLPQALRDEIEWDRSRDLDKYAHVWKGAYRTLSEERVFRRWRMEEFETPANAVHLYGADWGFSVDPTVLVRCHFGPSDKRTLYVDFERYKVGCEVEDTPDFFDGLTCGGSCDTLPQGQWCLRPGHGLARKAKITADSARPETISHVKRHGYSKMVPSVKGAKSVEEGISFLQSYDIIVHPRCKHVIDELTWYSYKVDELTGRVLPVLVDKKNHVIDSLRYAVEEVRRARFMGGVL